MNLHFARNDVGHDVCVCLCELFSNNHLVQEILLYISGKFFIFDKYFYKYFKWCILIETLFA